MLSRQICDEEQKQPEIENKRSNEYHLNQMRDQIIPNHSNFVTRDREDQLVHSEIPYKSEIQTPKLDEFSLQRQIKEKNIKGGK